MSPTLEFIRRDNTSFPRSFQQPNTIVPSFSATSSTPSSTSLTFALNDSSTSTSTTTTTSFSSPSSQVLTATTFSTSSSFSEIVTSISSLSSQTKNTHSATSSSSSSRASVTSTAKSSSVPSALTTSTSSPSSSTPSPTSLISATSTLSFQLTTSSPSESASVPATTTSVAIADGTSTSVVLIPATTAFISGKTAAASSSSSVEFWSNKAAVAGTFTGVAVVALATLAGMFLCIRKNRRESHSRDRSITEKFASMDFDNFRPYSTPSEPASHDLTHEPMDAYANRDPAYFPTHDPFVNNAHNMPYAGSASLPEITYSYAQDVNNQYPYYGNEANNVVSPLPGTSSTPALLAQNLPNPFEPVDNTPPVSVPRGRARTTPSPNPFNDPVFRGSPTYQPSVDSFYGAANDGRPF